MSRLLQVHSLVLTADGAVYSIGDPSYGATCNASAAADGAAVLIVSKCNGLHSLHSLHSLEQQTPGGLLLRLWL